MATADELSSPPVDFLRKLVSISSGTNDISGVGKVQMEMATELKKFGFVIEEFGALDPNVKSKQLVATRVGLKKEFITFVGHADTVFENLNHFEISSNGKEAKGSGVGDDKGGLVVGLFALQKFLKEKSAFNYSIRFVISPTEETGSDGFRQRLKDYAQDSALILGLEPASNHDSVVKARKGVRWYHLKVTGLEAHAGANPEAGVNACLQLAKFLQKMMALNNYEKGNTVSIGRMEGGKDKFNIVCGTAESKIDMRFVDLKSRDELHHKIETILKAVDAPSKKQKMKAKVEYEIITDVPPFAGSRKSSELIAKYIAIVHQIEGRDIQAVSAGGVSDLNYMDAGSAVMLDGLGPIGGGHHTIDEHVEISSLETRAEALAQLLIQFDKEAVKK